MKLIREPQDARDTLDRWYDHCHARADQREENLKQRQEEYDALPWHKKILPSPPDRFGAVTARIRILRQKAHKIWLRRQGISENDRVVFDEKDLKHMERMVEELHD